MVVGPKVTIDKANTGTTTFTNTSQYKIDVNAKAQDITKRVVVYYNPAGTPGKPYVVNIQDGGTICKDYKTNGNGNNTTVVIISRLHAQLLSVIIKVKYARTTNSDNQQQIKSAKAIIGSVKRKPLIAMKKKAKPADELDDKSNKITRQKITWQ